jgi:hypothetical protein
MRQSIRSQCLTLSEAPIKSSFSPLWIMRHMPLTTVTNTLTKMCHLARRFTSHILHCTLKVYVAEIQARHLDQVYDTRPSPQLLALRVMQQMPWLCHFCR